MAFAVLVVALAREVGIDARFVLIEGRERSDRRQDLRISYRHLAAGYGPPSRMSVLDLRGPSRAEARYARQISDRTAVAIFHSNRGAESLLEGEPGEALRWLKGAVRLDPQLPQAWVNLGVAERRLGRWEGAIEAYRRALEIEADFVPAQDNLRALGMTLEAASNGAGLGRRQGER